MEQNYQQQNKIFQILKIIGPVLLILLIVYYYTKKEDLWALWIGLAIFGLSIPSYLGMHILGRIPIAKPWTDISHTLSSKVFDS
jgi:hypothetical protein